MPIDENMYYAIRGLGYSLKLYSGYLYPEHILSIPNGVKNLV